MSGLQKGAQHMGMKDGDAALITTHKPEMNNAPAIYSNIIQHLFYPVVDMVEGLN